MWNTRFIDGLEGRERCEAQRIWHFLGNKWRVVSVFFFFLTLGQETEKPTPQTSERKSTGRDRAILEEEEEDKIIGIFSTADVGDNECKAATCKLDKTLPLSTYYAIIQFVVRNFFWVFFEKLYCNSFKYFSQ